MGSKDVTNNATATTNDTSSIILKTSAGEIDLRRALLSQVNVDKSFTGSWLSDYANASAATAGVTMDGKAGNDSLVGSNHADTIKAGTTGNVTISGGKGNDVLTAGTEVSSQTTFLFKAGDGQDIINQGKGDDTINLQNISLTNVTFTQDKKDLVIAYTENDKITIKNYFTDTNKKTVNAANSVRNINFEEGTFLLEKFVVGAQEDEDGKQSGYVEGTDAAETIEGASTKDIIYAKGGDDVITGGKGNDFLNGGAGNNKFIFNAGDGQDTIQGSANAVETIKLNNIGIPNISFAKDNNDLVLSYTDNDNITIKDYYDNLGNPASSVKYIEIEGKTFELETLKSYKETGTIIYAADTLVSGTAGNDLIFGNAAAESISSGTGNDIIYSNAGNDTVTAGKGNDVIYSTGGNNTYIFNSGDGTDVIEANSGVDTIKFVGAMNERELLLFTDADNGRDLIINYGLDRTSSITVKDYYDGNGGINANCGVKNLQFGASAPVTIEELLPIAHELDPSVVIGSGNDFAVNASTKFVLGGELNDTINLAASNQATVSVYAGEGNNTITPKAAATNYNILAGSGNDTISVSHGTDVIDAGDGENVISAGQGRKTITVGNATNATTNKGSSITFNSNSNNNSTITTGMGNDTISFVNTSDDMTVTSAGGNNEINYATGIPGLGAGITINTGAGNDTINIGNASGGSAENSINAGNGNNTINFAYGSFNNNITTGSGNDTINFESFGGNDTISIAAGTNTITFASNTDDESITAGGTNTIIFGDDDNSDNNHITLTGDGNDNVTIGYGHNNVITATGGGNKTISVGDTDHYSNSTNITTGAGDDTITIGESQMSIGKGATVNAGDGHNVIHTIGQNYGVNITVGNSTNTETNEGSEIVLNGDNRYTTITSGTGNDTIQFTGDSVLYANVTSTGGNNLIELRKTLDDYENNQYAQVTTGDGNDTITLGYLGNNTISGGNGNNVITVKGSNNIVTTGSGNDTIVMGIDGNSNTDRNTVTIGGYDNELGQVTLEGGVENAVTIHGGDNTVTINNTQQVDGKKNVITALDNTSERNTIIVRGGHTEVTAAGMTTVTTGDGNDTITLTNEYGYNSVVNAGNGNNTITAGHSATITTGNGVDVINLNKGGEVYAGAGNDTINVGEGNHSDSIHGGKGDDLIVLDEGKRGNSYIYMDEIAGQNGHDTLEGVGGNGSQYLAIMGDKSAEYVATKNGQDMNIAVYKNGVATGDVLTIKDAYDNEGNLIPVLRSSSNYVNGGHSNLWLENLATNMITTGVGTDNNDWIVGTSGNDTITTGIGGDFIKPGAGIDEITISGGSKAVYFMKGDGTTTIKGFNQYTDLSIFSDDLDNLSFSKVGQSLIITNSTGDKFIIENGFTDDGDLTNQYYSHLYNAETMAYYRRIDYVMWDADVDVYPDENGDIVANHYGVGVSICHPDSETANTIIVNPGANCRILGEEGDPLHTIVIPVGDSEYRKSAMQCSRDGDDFVIYDPLNPATARIVDFYAGNNTVGNINFGGYEPENYVIAETPWLNPIDVSDADSSQNVVGYWTANKITGSAYSDHLEGGQGNDDIYAQTGEHDNFFFSKGDGHDTIHAGQYGDKTRWGGVNDYGDSLSFFLDEVSFNDIELELSGNDLVVKYNHVDEVAQDSITVKDYIVDGEINSSIDYLQVSANHGQSWSINKKIVDRWMEQHGTINVTGSSPDIINGTPFNENFVINPLATGKTLNAGAGNDTIIVRGNNNTIYGGKGNDTISFESTGNTVNAGEGNNTIKMFPLDKTNNIVAGSGNDTIVLDSAYDDLSSLTATFSGDDLVFSYEDNPGTQLIAKDWADGGHSVKAVMSFDENSTADLSVLDGVTEGTIKFASNTATNVNGTAGKDIVFGGINNTVIQEIHTDAGDDIIYANDGTMSKLIDIGTGNDIVYTSADQDSHPTNTITITSTLNPDGGHDTIYWRGAATLLEMYQTHTKDDVIFTRVSDDLVMRYGEDNSVTFKEYYTDANQTAGIGEGIQISFKTVGVPESLTLADVLDYRGLYNYVTNGMGTEGNDYIVGTSGAEAISAGAGNDIVQPYAGDDEISLGAGNDTLFAGAGDKTITADSGNNTINLGTGTNTVYAGTGSDTINSGTGVNTIEFAVGDEANDTYKYGGGTDKLVFNDDLLADLSVDRTGVNPVITRGNGSTVTITNYAAPEHVLNIKDKATITTSIDNLNTRLGSATLTTAQTLTTYNGNDTILAGLGNDTISAGAGDDTITLAKGVTGNNDTYVYSSGDDTIVLTDVANFDSLILQKVDNDLLVAATGDLANNTVTISDFYTDESIKNNISFTAGETTQTLAALITAKGVTETINGTADADTLDKSESTVPVIINAGAGNDTVIGSDYADRLYGQAGNDSITGGAGNDYINGGAGDDDMIGGAGNDTYEIDADDWGTNQDSISDASGTDTLKINTTAENINLFFDVTLTKEMGDVVVNNGLASFSTGDDLYIINDDYYDSIADVPTSKGVMIEDFFTTGNIETVQVLSDMEDPSSWVNAFDSTVLTKFGQIVANWLWTNGFDSTAAVMASEDADAKAALYNLYHPVITAEEGWAIGYPSTDSVLIGMGTAPQSLSTFGGNDIIAPTNIAAGQNTVDAGAGNDVIYGSTGSLEVQAKEGNDTIYAGAGGNKYLYAGLGNDVIYTSTDASSNYIYLNEYNNTYDGGHDTIYWGGGNDNLVYLWGHNKSDLILAQDGDDLKFLYGEDSSVTFKDYYAVGNEDMATKMKFIATGDMGMESTLSSIVSAKTVLNYIEYETGAGLVGTDGNDYIHCKSGVSGISAGAGSDTVIVNGWTEVFTHTNTSYGKDTTLGVVDTVIMKAGNSHTVHAQAPTNILTAYGTSSDLYSAYIDQKTIITDAGGSDSLTIVKSSAEDTAANKENLHILFNVASDYDYDSENPETLFSGNVLLTGAATKANYDAWRADGAFTGASVTNNAVETLKSSDATPYSLSNTAISTLAESVAGWLSANGYASVDGVFSNALDKDDSNAVDIAAVIAKFDEAGWIA
ncbi:hypothetical protein IJI31_04160 [bacterium]|nr:hypothetical protein [bacterium]